MAMGGKGRMGQNREVNEQDGGYAGRIRTLDRHSDAVAPTAVDGRGGDRAARGRSGMAHVCRAHQLVSTGVSS